MIYDKKNKFSDLTLNKSEHEIIDRLDIGFFRVSLDGTIIAHNKKYNEIFGINPVKCLNGKNTINFWQNQHDREKFLMALRVNGKVKNYITSAKRITGDTIILQGNSHLIYDDNGLPIATEGTIIDITEKHNLQKELEESEKRYRDIAELLPDVIFETDANLNLTYVNSIAFDKFGYSKEELSKNLNIVQFIDITSRKLASKNLKLLFEGKETRPQQYLLIKKDGSKFYGLIHSRPRYKNNKVIGIRGTITDINNLVLAEQELKKSEEKFRRIFESIPDLFFLVSEDSTILDFTGKEEDLYIPLEEFIGKRLSEVLPSNVGSLINEHIKKTLETQNPHYLEYSIPIKNEIRHFEARFLYFSKNSIAILIRNISERKKTEAKLKESEEKFRTIAEQSLLGIAILQDNTFKYVNEKFAGVGGRSIDEVMGWKLIDFINTIHPEDKKIIIEYAKKRQQGVETERSGYECRCFKKNGDLMWVQTYSKSIIFEGRLADQITILDITNSKLAEQKLKESEEKFRTMAEQSLMGICIIQDFEIKYLNQQMADIYEYPLTEISKWKQNEFLKVLHPEFKKMATEQLTKKQQNASDVLTHYIAKIITKNGTIKYIENYSKTVTFHGKPADLMTQIDITPKMNAEQRVKESEEKYRHLYESSPYAILLVNLEGKIIDCNLATETLFGFRRRELIGMNFANSSFIPKEQIYTLIKDFKKLIKNEIPEPGEVQIYTRKKKSVWVTYQASICTIENENIIQLIIEDISERKKAEEKIKESESKYHELFETSPDGVILTDLQGKIIECNTALEVISGYSSSYFIDKNFLELDLYQEDGLERVKKGYRNLFGDQILDTIEFPIKTKENQLKWVQINAKLLDMKSKIYILTVIHDITSLKEAENALKENEKKFRDILETSSVGVMELDVINKNLLYINPKLIEIIGYKKEEINEEVFRNKIIYANDLYNLLKTNEEAELEFRITDKQGRMKWLAGKRIPHYNERGEIESIRVWLDDITEKKIYENLIYELNINFLNFTTNIRKNIDLLLNTCLKLLEGDLLLYVYKTSLDEKENYQIISSDGKTYNYNTEEFDKLFISILFREEHDFPQTYLNIDRMLNFDNDHFVVEHKLRGCFGKAIKSQEDLNSAVCIFYKNNPIVSGQDKLVLFLICDAVEIEQKRWQVQKDLEKQNITLNKINKLKSELFSRTSHELKTPLISVKGFTELLLTLYTSKLDPEIISILEEIRDGSKRLEKIINLLLDSTKLEAGQLSLNLHDEDLTFLIKFCVKELQGLAKLREQTISLNLQDELKTKFDKERIYEVISNLLVNAIKYTPPGGDIIIETKKNKESYIFSIQDNGIGFTEEERSMVFKQFGKIERYGQGWDIAADGTGLGLYITKKLVELHGGKIWLESEGRNKGTTFYFSIPILK